MKIPVKKLRENAVLPMRASAGAAGADLYACLEEEAVLLPGQTTLIPTGLSLEIPEGYVGLVFARSSVASKRGLAPANKVGVIDSDYRGELMVALFNHGSAPQTVLPNERIAQLVVVPFLAAEYAQVQTLSDTVRGSGGFGSTGK
ncbi:MAG: dUTP diphosphatase [Clostridia bacterium]|nr:dUTP diphosphatase [Clostridia bacterium]